MFSVNIDPTRRHLLLQIVGGRAFLEHLNDNDVDSSLTVHVHFRGQRFCSQPTPCACEPNINEVFVLEIHKETSGVLQHNVLNYIIAGSDRQWLSSIVSCCLTQHGDIVRLLCSSSETVPP